MGDLNIYHPMQFHRTGGLGRLMTGRSSNARICPPSLTNTTMGIIHQVVAAVHSSILPWLSLTNPFCLWVRNKKAKNGNHLFNCIIKVNLLMIGNYALPIPNAVDRKQRNAQNPKLLYYLKSTKISELRTV